jgi:hypothetical protein
MRDFKEDHQTIRQFLLGQLSDDKAKGIEDRVFAEADFAEEVQIVENELITEYSEGNLIAEERTVFETKYSQKKAERTILEYEKLFSEFIHSKSDGILSPRPPKLQPSDAAFSSTRINAPQVSLKSPREGPWLHSIFRSHPAFAYSAILFGFLLSVAAIWYLFGQRIVQPGNPLEAQRQAIEAKLARLNTLGAGPPGKVLLTVNLQPAERSQGAMARVAADHTTPDALVEFRLSLTEASNQEYRALFLDDRHRELFSISKLTAQGTPGGPEVRFVVPAIYLNPGDYQINLSLSNKNGGYDEVNSYPARVVKK